jgi:hypothetical protein
MKFELDQIDVHNNGVWISKKELERKFKELRQKGYDNDKLWREGCAPCQMESVICHAKADVLWDLISLIDNE